MHTSCRKPAANLLGHKRAESIAHDSVEQTAALLGVDQLHVDGSGALNTVLHGVLGNLVECNAILLIRVKPQNIGKMPRNGFSFAVRVGCEIDEIALFGSRLDFLDKLFLALDDLVLGLEIVLDVHTQSALRQVAHVTHRGDHIVARAEVFFYCLCLGRRLDYN